MRGGGRDLLRRFGPSRRACRWGASIVTNDDPPSVETLQLVEETIDVRKRIHETGRVSVHTVTDQESLIVRDNLLRNLIDVERVPIGKPIDTAPPQREEDDCLIIPIIEERLVVEKRLFLVEELRIRRSTVSVPVEVPVTRRVMRAVVERDTPVASTPEETRT